jgi:hypothetical protein
MNQWLSAKDGQPAIGTHRARGNQSSSSFATEIWEDTPGFRLANMASTLMESLMFAFCSFLNPFSLLCLVSFLLSRNLVLILAVQPFTSTRPNLSAAGCFSSLDLGATA